jgi:hypothetical protein
MATVRSIPVAPVPTLKPGALYRQSQAAPEIDGVRTGPPVILGAQPVGKSDEPKPATKPATKPTTETSTTTG